MRIVLLEAGEADRGHEFRGSRARGRRDAAGDLEGKQHVVERAAPGQQVIVLGDVADAPLQAGFEAARLGNLRRLAIEKHLAARGDIALGDDVEQRRLA